MSTLTRKDLVEIIGKKTIGVGNYDELVKGIAAYLAAERQNYDLGSLTRDIMQYRLDHAGIVEAVIVSAHSVNDLVIRDLTALLREQFPSAKKIIIDQKIDESVVGGIRIELPRENLDLSIRSKLNLFKRLVAEEKM